MNEASQLHNMFTCHERDKTPDSPPQTLRTNSLVKSAKLRMREYLRMDAYLLAPAYEGEHPGEGREIPRSETGSSRQKATSIARGPMTTHLAHRVEARVDGAIVTHVEQLCRGSLHHRCGIRAVLGAGLQDLEPRVKRGDVINDRVVVRIWLEEATVEVARQVPVRKSDHQVCVCPLMMSLKPWL